MEKAEARLPEEFFRGLAGDQIQAVRRAFGQAGIRFRTDGSKWYVRSSDRTCSLNLIQLTSLHRADGQLIKGIHAELTGAPHVVSPEFAAGLAATLRELEESGTLESRGPWGDLQLRLIADDDPVHVLSDVLRDDPGLRFFQISPTEAFQYRDVFWKLLTEIADGGSTWADYLTEQSQLNFDAVSGMASTWPGLFVAGALVARDQPLAIVLTTAHGAQLLGLRDQPYQRLVTVSSWPVGLPTVSLGNTWAPTTHYALPTLSTGHGHDLLSCLVDGANNLVWQISDPGAWISESGEVDVGEQRIRWSSLQWGLETLLHLGEEWPSRESLWTAFRALQQLEGLWGSARDRIDLARLLDPETIRAFAIAPSTCQEYEDWAVWILKNYEHELSKMSDRGEVRHGVQVLEQIRHLLHGSGVLLRSNSRDPAARVRRIAAMRAVRGVNLQWTKYIPVIWWTSVVMNPQLNALPGRPPFSGSTRI